MPLYAFSIDLDRCIGCQACTVACKIGNERPLDDNYIKVRDIVSGQMPKLFGTFAHHRCFHCADAACVAVCPTGTLTKAANGMTAVAQEKCIGCGYCVNACPYGVPTLTDGRVSKCVGCLDAVQEGGTPYCVQTCPSKAIRFDERDTLLADAQARVAGLKTRYPNAQVYGQSQLGGLGLLMVLLDKPDVYGLPERPRVPSPIYVWQMVHPLTLPAIVLSAVFTGFSFVVARREHAREKAVMHAEAALAVLPPAATSEEIAAPHAQIAPDEVPSAATSGEINAAPAESASDETLSTAPDSDKEST